jgi:hypothetical protein
MRLTYKSQVLNYIIVTDRICFIYIDVILVLLATTNMKHLGINLIKYIQNSYKDNYKALMKEIQDPN